MKKTLHNYRLSNICAGIGRGQMEILDSHIEKRREMHQFYKNVFVDQEGITIFSEPNEDYYSNHWLSAIIINSEKNNGKSREDLRLLLENENIESRPLWKPMHLQPVFKNAPYYGGSVSEEFFNNGLCLPSGSNLNSDDVARIKSVLFDKFLNK